MTEYIAPIEEISFVINEIAGIREINELSTGDETPPDLISAILEEAGKFSSEVLAPINRKGDIDVSIIENGVVRTPEGFKSAYEKFIASGWNGMPFDEKYGGQGLPWLLSTAVSEMVQSANLSFSLCNNPEKNVEIPRKTITTDRNQPEQAQTPSNNANKKHTRKTTII